KRCSKSASLAGDNCERLLPISSPRYITSPQSPVLQCESSSLIQLALGLYLGQSFHFRDQQFFNVCGQRSYRRLCKELSQRHLYSEHFFDMRKQACRQQGVSPQIEEVVFHTGIHTQQL